MVDRVLVSVHAQNLDVVLVLNKAGSLIDARNFNLCRLVPVLLTPALPLQADLVPKGSQARHDAAGSDFQSLLMKEPPEKSLEARQVRWFLPLRDIKDHKSLRCMSRIGWIWSGSEIFWGFGLRVSAVRIQSTCFPKSTAAAP